MTSAPLGPPLRPVATALPVPVAADPPVLVVAATDGWHLLARDRAAVVVRVGFDHEGHVVAGPAGVGLDSVFGATPHGAGVAVTGQRDGAPWLAVLAADGAIAWHRPLPSGTGPAPRPVPARPGGAGDDAVMVVTPHRSGVGLLRVSADGTETIAEVDVAGALVATDVLAPDRDGRIRLVAAVDHPSRLVVADVDGAGGVRQVVVPDAVPVAPQLAGDDGGRAWVLWSITATGVWGAAVDDDLEVVRPATRLVAVEPGRHLTTARLLPGGRHPALALRTAGGLRHGGVVVHQAVVAVDLGLPAAGPWAWLSPAGGAFDGGAWSGDRLAALHGGAEPHLSLFARG